MPTWGARKTFLFILNPKTGHQDIKPEKLEHWNHAVYYAYNTRACNNQGVGFKKCFRHQEKGDRAIIRSIYWKESSCQLQNNDIQLIACADVRLPFCLRHSPTLFLSEPLFASRTASIQVLVGKGSPVQVLCSDPSPNSKLIKIIQKYRCNVITWWSFYQVLKVWGGG